MNKNPDSGLGLLAIFTVLCAVGVGVLAVLPVLIIAYAPMAIAIGFAAWCYFKLKARFPKLFDALDL